MPKSQYDVDRDLANKSNARLRRIHRMKYSGQEIHEIKPVRFGGSPTDIGNKVALSREAHAEYTKWWRKIQRWAECRVKKMKKGRGR